MTINYVDIAVIIILLLCIYNTRRKGFTYLIASMISKLISIAASISLYGKVAHYLRQTPLFPAIKGHIESVFNIDELDKLVNPVNHIDLGQNAGLGASLFQNILANDNPEIYKLFKVETYTDYVSSYFANIAINIISIIIVYISVGIAIKAIFRANRIISRLPGIRQLNSFASLIGGFAEGVILIWILVIVLMCFAIQGMFTEVYAMLLSSKIAIYFLEYNIFAKIIFNILP